MISNVISTDHILIGVSTRCGDDRVWGRLDRKGDHQHPSSIRLSLDRSRVWVGAVGWSGARRRLVRECGGINPPKNIADRRSVGISTITIYDDSCGVWRSPLLLIEYRERGICAVCPSVIGQPRVPRSAHRDVGGRTGICPDDYDSVISRRRRGAPSQRRICAVVRCGRLRRSYDRDCHLAYLGAAYLWTTLQITLFIPSLWAIINR